MATHNFNTTLATKYGIDEAIIIEQIYWWVHKNECEEIEDMIHEGRVWCRSTAKGFAKYIPYMKPDKIWRILRKLEGTVLMVGNFNKKALNQTLWYTFTDEFKKELKALDCDFEKNKNAILKNEKSNNSIINNPINDNNIQEYNKKRLSNDNQKNEEYSDDFLEFWKAYGYSKDKGTAYKRWKKLSEKDKKAALKAIPAYFADCEIHTRDKRYPAVYINKRTWEDDFTSPEGKEETIADARAPMDEEQWERNQRWMEENTPKYVGRISFDDFISMRGEVMLNSRIYGEILKEIHQSGYEGDIVAEFKRRNDERICSHG